MVKEAQDNGSFLERLRTKWKLKNFFQVIMVIIVFSLTGMTVVTVRPIVFSWFGYDETTPFWLKTITYILLIFPMYQILILVYGSLLGQFSFFWEKEKKLFNTVIKPFQAKVNKNVK